MLACSLHLIEMAFALFPSERVPLVFLVVFSNPFLVAIFILVVRSTWALFTLCLSMCSLETVAANPRIWIAFGYLRYFENLCPKIPQRRQASLVNPKDSAVTYF